jgi:uncharacterized protein (TIGR03437 family)
MINYLIPAGTSNGAVTITLRRNGADIAQVAANIDTVAPGLVSANASWQGVVAALILSRRNGVDTFDPVAQFNSTANRFDPIQFDLGPTTDTVFLATFGTGSRAAPQSASSATIGGMPFRSSSPWPCRVCRTRSAQHSDPTLAHRSQACRRSIHGSRQDSKHFADQGQIIGYGK